MCVIRFRRPVVISSSARSPCINLVDIPDSDHRVGRSTIFVVYEVRIQRSFTARHALTINGVPEPLHQHQWQMEVCVEGPNVDADGLLVDFHELERVVDEVIAPMRDSNLNELEAFRNTPSSAELVAKHVADEIAARMTNPDVRFREVRITEAPGCIAVYRPDA